MGPHPPAPRFGRLTDDFDQFFIDEVKAHAIVRCKPGQDQPLPDELFIGGASVSLAVVVGAVASLQKAQAWQNRQWPCNAVSDALFEPADGSRAPAAQDNPLVVGLSKGEIHAPVPPYREHAASISAAHENGVLLTEKALNILRRSGKEGEVGGFGVELAEGGVIPKAAGLRVPVGGADEADLWLAGARQTEEVFDQLEAALIIHGERRSANGKNLSSHARN